MNFFRSNFLSSEEDKERQGRRLEEDKEYSREEERQGILQRRRETRNTPEIGIICFYRKKTGEPTRSSFTFFYFLFCLSFFLSFPLSVFFLSFCLSVYFRRGLSVIFGMCFFRDCLPPSCFGPFFPDSYLVIGR